MTKLSKGCFWELFDPEWAAIMAPGGKAPTRPSLCHPWSAGATSFMSKHLLGIGLGPAPQVPVRVAPFLSRRHHEVNGSVGTADGRVVVAARLLDDDDDKGVMSALIEVRSPRAVSVGVPLHGGGGDARGALLSMSAESSADAAASFAATAGELQRATHAGAVHAFTPTLSAGITWRVLGRYARIGTPAPHAQGGRQGGRQGGGEAGAADLLSDLSPFPPPSYAANWSLDRETRGDWPGVYGRDGYVLFGFDEAVGAASEAEGAASEVEGAGSAADAQDLVRLPPSGFVRRVNVPTGCCSGPKRVFVGADATGTNLSMLVDPRPPGATKRGAAANARRALGLVSSGSDASQGVLVDVDSEEGVPYEVAVYVAGGGTLAIRVLDLATLAPIARTPLLSAFDDGVYWRLSYNRGVRLRIMSIDGRNRCSAVLFDRRLPAGVSPAAHES